jgi:putative ABC transport system substrate-binding protein
MDCGSSAGQKDAISISNTDGSGGAATPLPALAAELVRLNPDLIIVSSTPGAQAVQKATTIFPQYSSRSAILLQAASWRALHDPEKISLGSRILTSNDGKIAELLKAAVTSATRFAVLRDPNNAGKQIELSELQVLGRNLVHSRRWTK